MKKCFFFIILLLSEVSLSAQIVERIPGSPYPASTVPDTLTTVYSSYFSDSELLTIATLQGLLAKTKPRIYQLYNTGANKWAIDLRMTHGIVLERSIEKNFSALIEKFKDEIKGYVVCVPGNSSANAAISLCGLTQSVAIAQDKIDMFNNLGIPMTADVRGKNEEWFYTNYADSLNKNILIYQKEDKYGFLSDYAVFGNMLMYFEPLSGTFSRKVFQAMNPQAPILGWGDSEYDLVNRSSQYSILVHPADWAKNLSTLSNFNVDLNQKNHDFSSNSATDMHTVCFLFSDGDNVQWLLNEFATNSRWFGSTKRGKINLGWTVPPAMAELAPTALKYIYDNAATAVNGRDYFVSGPSGLGYVYPERYKDLEGYAGLTNSFMQKADLRIVNIIGNSDDDRYLTPFLEQSDIDALFFYFFSNYSGGAGKVKWVSDKPVIYGRYNFWDGFEDVNSLAAKINSASRNVNSSASYSLIPVHNWSRSVDDVLQCAALFDDDVRVVAPDEFVGLIRENLKPMSSIESFTPTNNETELKYLTPEYLGTGVDNVSRWADGEDKIVYKFPKADLVAMSDGQDDLRIQFTISNEYVVSVAGELNGEPVVVHKWSESDEHIHDDTNRIQKWIDIKKYYDRGWENVYLIFEDGIKSDGWGAKLTYFKILKSDLSTSVESKMIQAAPMEFELHQNYPNPFNPSTTIAYHLNTPGAVTLKIYNMIGKPVKTLVNSNQSAGRHQISWDGLNDAGGKVSSGVYFYKLSSGGSSQVKKMMLMQ